MARTKSLPIERICIECGVDFTISGPYGRTRKFCGRDECARSHRVKITQAHQQRNPAHHENHRTTEAKRRARRPEAIRATTIRKHGISVEQYNECLERQGGCAVCGTPTPNWVNWVIDHDHACCPGDTGCAKCFRGILCQQCNLGLGHFDDDPAKLIAAVAYLQRGMP